MTPDRVAVTRLVAAHRPATAQETRHRERMLELAGASGDPFARDHWRPGHFTASAFVLAPARDAVLLILHAALGRWLQPGGHVEPGDADLVAAARREVGEETGIAPADLLPLGDGIFDVDVHAIPARGDAPAHEHFDVRYAFGARTRAMAASAEVRAARWTPLVELDRLTDDPSVLRAARKLVALAAAGPGTAT